MADVFISYAREDLERVRPIVRLLEGAGWSVFWDRTIPPGMTWRQFIGKALDDATCVIVVWSESSVVSDWVIEEADDGRQRKILIPITIEVVKPPLGFRSFQHGDFSEWRGDAEHKMAKNLLKSIERIVEESPPPEPLPQKEKKEETSDYYPLDPGVFDKKR